MNALDGFAEPKWIWLPELRNLPCTFAFFRREIEVGDDLEKAAGFITTDSRYQLYINGQRVQRGPAPYDPRHHEFDPFDITDFLHPGTNTIGILVCFFGYGEGTYIPGNPGLWFTMALEYADRRETMISDHSWKVLRAKCWKPGQYKRWFIRALQEDFDARLYPDGWNTNGFEDGHWEQAMEQDVDPDKPIVCLKRSNTISDFRVRHEMGYDMTAREIPAMREERVSKSAPTENFEIHWKKAPEEFFDHQSLNSFEKLPFSDNEDSLETTFTLKKDYSNVFIYEFDEEIVGFPYIRVNAPAGTVLELMFAESRERLLLTHIETTPGANYANYVLGSWLRLTTGEGMTEFEAFDYEALRFLCVAVRGKPGDAVELLEAGVVRRVYPFSHTPDFQCSDPVINRVHAAGVNTCLNICQETIVDNMVRERQQYSGDVGNTKLSAYYGFGEYRLPRRVIQTFARGQNHEGWFFDCFPAWDRLERLWQKAIRTTTSPSTGMIIDHGIGFIHDIYNYVMHSGDTETLAEVYGNIKAHGAWLEKIETEAGNIPVEGIPEHSTWIDHTGFQQQRHKACAMNIYYYGYLAVASAFLADTMGDTEYSDRCRVKAEQLKTWLFGEWWDDRNALFTDNLPWLDEEASPRYHDRTLAMALLFDLVPEDRIEPSLRMLTDCPDCMGFSHPANAGWRLWALSKYGRGNTVVSDLRDRWGNLRQVLENNTLPESWQVGGAWCQCPAAPIFVLYGEVLGIRPLEPGYRKALIYPQPGDFASMSGSVRTPLGDIVLKTEQENGKYALDIHLPGDMTGLVVLPDNGKVAIRSKSAYEQTPATHMGKKALEIHTTAPTHISVTGDK